MVGCSAGAAGGSVARAAPVMAWSGAACPWCGGSRTVETGPADAQGWVDVLCPVDGRVWKVPAS